MRLLLVEDDAMIGMAAQDALSRAAFAVDWVRDGRAASAALESNAFDAVVLDLGLPHRDGTRVLKEARASGNTTPVLVLTACDAVADKIAALDSGADDYVTKPFDITELCARIRAVVRRRAGRADSLVTYGDLQVNLSTHSVTRAGTELALSPREFSVLAALIERPGHVLSRTRLQERIYRWDEEIASNSIDVYVHALRRKLGHDLIRTVRGVGYALTVAS